MTSTLNQAGILPLSQPYNCSLWNYQGTESVTAIPDPNIIDWVLVGLRDAPDAISATSATIFAQQAAFLLNNGTIVGMDGNSLLSFYHTINHSLFAAIWHRNHPGVISANPLLMNSLTYSYDFSAGEGQVLGHKDLGGGVFGMFAGDGNADDQVNNGDKIDIWALQAGTGGYLSGDFNMDIQVNNNDKNDIWIPNTGMGGQVPE